MDFDRRRVLWVASAGASSAVMAACGGVQARGGGRPSGDEAQEVSPVEDLMQEHGLLERLLAIYEESARRLRTNESLPPGALREATAIMQTFVHDYHERNEEQSIFPRAERVSTLTQTVRTLYAQHQRGREVTIVVASLSEPAALASRTHNDVLISACAGFVRMYRPHAARENSVVFPATRALFTHRAWHELGEHFETQEHQRFGEGGFEAQVARVADIERTLGIEDLAQFTPPVPMMG